MALKFNRILAGTLISAVVITSLILHTTAALGGGKGGLLGGWSRIKNTNDHQVVEIAKFAVDQYNKESKSELVFKKVVKGDTQVVAGTNYRLIIAVKDRGYGNEDRYLAVVWDKPWENYRNVTSFKKL